MIGVVAISVLLMLGVYSYALAYQAPLRPMAIDDYWTTTEILLVTTVTAPTTSTSFLRSYITSTTTLTVPESTTTASTQVTETSAGASVTVTQIVVVVTQTEYYILETLTSSSTELRTTTILVPGTTETQHGTTSQTTYAIETTKTVDYLLVALAFATPALLLAWALILLRRRY